MNEMCVVKDYNSTVTSFIIHSTQNTNTHTTTNTPTFKKHRFVKKKKKMNITIRYRFQHSLLTKILYFVK